MNKSIDISQKAPFGKETNQIGIQNITINTINLNVTSTLEATELTKRTIEGIENNSMLVSRDDFLNIDITAYSIVPVTYVNSSFIYTFDFFGKKGKICTFKFKKGQNKAQTSEFKCSVTDLDGTDLNLYTQFGSLGILPQSIHKYLNFIGKGNPEVILTSNQIVIGKTKDENIVLAGIEPNSSGSYLPVKVALYVPSEVIP